LRIKISPNPEVNNFWKDQGQKIIGSSLDVLDERAKFMITTCASLIIIDFGLLLAFKIQSIPINVTPQLFFAISAAFFVISYSPVNKRFNLLSPKSIENAYHSWMKWKLLWHYGGFALFLAGLLAFAIISII
jgi:hypothetical protein